MEFFIIVALIFIIVCYFIYIFGSNKRTQKLLKKYSKVKNSCGLTGGEFILGAFDTMGYTDCELQYTDKKNTDCYIPKLKLIVLHQDYCYKPTLSALGVAAHEFGHCVQHKQKKPIYLLTSLLGFVSKLAKILCLPLFTVGIYYVCTYQFEIAQNMVIAGAVCIVIGILFNLLLIPCELNASKIGVEFLKKYKLIKPSEERELKKVLKAAANTYVASFYRSIGINSQKHK